MSLCTPLHKRPRAEWAGVAAPDQGDRTHFEHSRALPERVKTLPVVNASGHRTQLIPLAIMDLSDNPTPARSESRQAIRHSGHRPTVSRPDYRREG